MLPDLPGWWLSGTQSNENDFEKLLFPISKQETAKKYTFFSQDFN